jgi:hypothetical protein
MIATIETIVTIEIIVIIIINKTNIAHTSK